METTNEELIMINETVTKSKEVLQNLVNDIGKIRDVVQPELLKTIKGIRDSRQTISLELKQTLSIMKDVRKFFLEKDYDTEMRRMERFVALCKEIKNLQADGTFDAVCDTSIRLAIMEEKSNDKKD